MSTSAFHLAQYPAFHEPHPLCKRGAHTDVQRRFGHVRVEIVIAPIDSTCRGCLVEREKLRERETAGCGHIPLVGVLIT